LGEGVAGRGKKNIGDIKKEKIVEIKRRKEGVTRAGQKKALGLAGGGPAAEWKKA